MSTDDSFTGTLQIFLYSRHSITEMPSTGTPRHGLDDQDPVQVDAKDGLVVVVIECPSLPQWVEEDVVADAVGRVAARAEYDRFHVVSLRFELPHELDQRRASRFWGICFLTGACVQMFVLPSRSFSCGSRTARRSTSCSRVSRPCQSGTCGSAASINQAAFWAEISTVCILTPRWLTAAT